MPGEIHVVCKIFDDMTCRIVVVAPVHGRSEASPSRRGTEAETATGTVERAAPVIVREGLPSFEIPPPQATPQAAAPRFPSQFLSCGQATPAQPLSPSSPAIQDVRTALLQLDNSRAAGGGSGGKDEGGGGGGGGEGGGYVSESQSSFYDSDDVFSDFEAPVNLQATYASLTPNRKKNLEGGAPKREVRAHAERPPAVADTALLSGRRPVSHLVSLEELYNFRPSQLVIRSGDCVRFRRSAALSVLNLSCAGEFSDSAVNTPCTLSVYLVPGDPLAEEQYFCFDHVFRHAGEFEVQNEIFSFNKCCVTVLRENDPKPNDDVKNYRSGVGNTHSKPSAAPKLRGSFSGPALPVFYKPIEGAAKAPRAEEAESCSGVGAKRPICAGSASPFRAPPTTTIVNASTTTVCSTATPATCGSSVLPALFTSPPSLLGLTETPTSRSSPRTTPTPTNRANRLSPMPLFGSFSSRTSHTTTCSSSPANTAPAFDDAAISAVVEAIAQAENDEPTDDEEGSGGCGAAEDPAARKKREKARKKREKLKLKKKMKKLAEEEELANDELQPLLGEDVGYDEISAARRTPEAVIRNYLNDSSRSHAFYAAQADYGEEFPDSDQEPPGHDHASGPTTSVEPDDPVGGSPESATSADMATKRKRTRPRSKSSGKLNRSVSTEGTQTADADASDEAGSQSTVVEQSHPQQHDASVDASPSPPTSSPTIAVDLGIQEPLFVVPDVVGGSTEKTPQPQKTVTVDMPETTTAITAPDTVTKRKRGKPRSKSSAKLDNAGLVDDLPQAANAGDGSFNPEATASIAITSESAQKVQTLPPQQQQPALAVVDASPASPLLPPAVEEPATVAFSDLQAAAGILLPPASSEPVASSDFVTPVKHRRRRESASEQPGVPATDGPAEELFCTPPSRMPPSAATSTSAAAALLKAALQISPQNKNSDPPDNQHREMDTPNSQLFTTPGQFTPAFTRTQIPAENAAVFPSTQRQERSPPSTPASTTAKEDTRLSMLVAYEQQMEEFLMSRKFGTVLSSLSPS